MINDHDDHDHDDNDNDNNNITCGEAPYQLDGSQKKKFFNSRHDADLVRH